MIVSAARSDSPVSLTDRRWAGRKRHAVRWGRVPRSTVLLIGVAILIQVACGKKGPPAAPFVRVPAPMTDLRVQRISHNDVFVTPAGGGKTLAPFWRGEERARSNWFTTRAGVLLEHAEVVLAAVDAGSSGAVFPPTVRQLITNAWNLNRQPKGLAGRSSASTMTTASLVPSRGISERPLTGSVRTLHAASSTW